MHKSLRVLYAVVGLSLLVYGFRVILAQEISAEGSLWRGAAWAIHGDSAIGLGAMIAAVGVFIIYQVIKNK